MCQCPEQLFRIPFCRNRHHFACAHTAWTLDVYLTHDSLLIGVFIQWYYDCLSILLYPNLVDEGTAEYIIARRKSRWEGIAWLRYIYSSASYSHEISMQPIAKFGTNEVIY